MKWLRDLFASHTKKTSKKEASFPIHQRTSIEEVMQKVDKQIGRAVTRLADR